jgi:hypothetical protein
MNQTTSRSGLSTQLLDVIKTHIGSESAIQTKDLSALFDVNDRDIRSSVAELRQSGEPILSSEVKPYGYYWPRDAKEAGASFNHMINRIRQLNLAIKGIERGLTREFANQLILDNLIKTLGE